MAQVKSEISKVMKFSTEYAKKHFKSEGFKVTDAPVGTKAEGFDLRIEKAGLKSTVEVKGARRTGIPRRI